MTSVLERIYKFLINNNNITKALVTSAILAFCANRYLKYSSLPNYNKKTINNPKERDHQIRIEKIFIYPIKSCRPIQLVTSELNQYGLINDRRWMLVHNNRFMSQRSQPEIGLIQPKFSEDGKILIVNAPGMPELRVPIIDDKDITNFESVGIWGDNVQAINCGEETTKYFSEIFKKEVKLVQIPTNPKSYQRVIVKEFLQNIEEDNSKYQVNFSDASQVMLISQSSLNSLNQKISEEREKRGEEQRPDLTWQRFRPNILLSSDGLDPFEEDNWREFKIGNLIFKMVEHTGRCKVTTVEPSTSTIDPYSDEEPLRTLRLFRKTELPAPFFGILAIHNGKGSINVGDQIEILNDTFSSKNHSSPKPIY